MYKERSWDLNKIMIHIEETSNNKDVLNVINSIGQYSSIFKYHSSVIKENLDRHFKEVTSELEQFKLILGQSENQLNHNYGRIECEANFIACAHTCRNVYDIFSQLINNLILENDMKVHDCDIKKIRKILPPSPLKEEINNLVSSFEFEYVEAFSNTVKHRCLVRALPRVVFYERQFSLQISAFKYKGNSYSEYWMSDALQLLVDLMNRIIFF